LTEVDWVIWSTEFNGLIIAAADLARSNRRVDTDMACCSRGLIETLAPADRNAAQEVEPQILPLSYPYLRLQRKYHTSCPCARALVS